MGMEYAKCSGIWIVVVEFHIVFKFPISNNNLFCKTEMNNLENLEGLTRFLKADFNLI
jgi:hypothetical protein